MKLIVVTKELCDQYSYANPFTCPLFHALRLAGVHVRAVGSTLYHTVEGDVLTVFFGLADYQKVRETGIPRVILLGDDGNEISVGGVKKQIDAAVEAALMAPAATKQARCGQEETSNVRA